jgi:hypothetical protein
MKLYSIKEISTMLEIPYSTAKWHAKKKPPVQKYGNVHLYNDDLIDLIKAKCRKLKGQANG